METTEYLIHEISTRVRFFKNAQTTDKKTIAGLTDRETTLLELINAKKEITISEISDFYPSVSNSTISNAITKLWRDKLVNKTGNPKDQRITTISLSKKGQNAVLDIQQHNSNVYKTIVKAFNLTDEEEKIFNTILKKGIIYFDKKK